MQFQLFLRDQRVELFFRQALFAHFCQLFRHHTQIGIQLIARRFDINGALGALEQHPAVEAQRNVLHAVLTEALLNVPEQRLTRQIRTPVAQQRGGFSDRLPGGIPHHGEPVLTHGISGDADWLCPQRRERRDRSRRFTLAFQLAEGFVDLLNHRAAIHIPDHDQRHRVRGVPFLIERFYLFGIDRLFQRLCRVVPKQR